MKVNLKVWLEKCGAQYSQGLADKFWDLVQENMGSSLEPGGHLYNNKNSLVGVFGVEHGKVNPYPPGDVDPAVINKIIETTKKARKLLKPEIVYGDYEPTLDALSKEKDALFWLKVFTPEQVDKIGKGKVLSSPVYKAEELEDGAILLVLNEDPWTCDKKIREKVRRHLFG